MTRTCAANITPRPIKWFWPQYLAAGKLHILAGDAGTGKTTLALRLAATISTGGKFPDGSQTAPGSVLILSTEDDTHDVLTPRLITAGADRSRIYFDDSLPSILNAPPSDLELVIIDPIISIIEGNQNDNSTVRAGLQPLIDLARESGAAVIGITHLTKATSKSAGTDAASIFQRVTGSLAFGATARVVWAVQPGPSDSSATVSVIKSNIGPTSAAISYRIQQCHGASVALWPGERQPPASPPKRIKSPTPSDSEDIFAGVFDG